MDAYLQSEMLSALLKGDLGRLVAYAAIFFFIWIEVRGLKKEVAKLTFTIAKSFADGEARFEQLEHRLTVLEQTHH